MDNLEALTDDQLRLRLVQYGFANLPVTETTRKTLIKKLRNHMNNTNSSLRKTTSLVTRYSSGEESDDTKGMKTRKARMTTSGSPSGRIPSDQNMPPPKSVSQPAMSLSKPATPTSTSIYGRSAVNSSGGKKNSVYVSPVIINDSEDDEIDWSVKKNRSPPKGSSPRNRSDFYTTLDSSPHVNGNGYDDEDDANTTSDYTKRLLKLREDNIQRQNNNNAALRKRTSYSSQRLSDYQPDDIVYHAEPSLEPAHIPLNITIKNFVNRLDAAYGFKQTFVPMVLLSLLVVFFVLIVFAYVTISPNIENILNPATTLYVPCDESHTNDASYSCVNEYDLEPSLSLLKLLAPELQARAISQRCGDKSKSISNIMCVKDFWQFLSEKHPQNRYVSGNSQGLDMIKDVHNIEYLVDRNKQWGISNVDENGDPASLEDVLLLRAHQAECFAVLKPKLPLTCTIYNKIQTFFFIIGTLAIISIVVFIVRKFYYFVLHVKEKRRAQIDQIIREICSTLMEKSIHDKENPSVVLNHLRDKIVEPSKRSELSWAWNEAVTYLEQNDSRVHFGIENINGEDFKVIRWIDDTKSSPSLQSSMAQQQTQMQQRRFTQVPEGITYATTKKWMGSAFDKSNKIKDPPTNCLKIRQMFNKYEAQNPNLPTIIQDTILQKLREKNCKVYDIQLDLKTCCVYVKCGTTADAGIVHEEMNGWWLDAGLVVVKFLKQEKYHQRFPTSVNANTCLQPSSNFFVTQGDGNGNDDYYDDEIDDDDFE